jgi:glycosyltransferase involved in cell wall biosynthesis
MTEKNKIHILMLGTSLQVPGGISSVEKQILQHRWPEDLHTELLPTYIEGSRIRQLRCFLTAYRALSRRLANKEPLTAVHLHMSYGGSFIRMYAIHRLVKRYGQKDIVHLHGSEFKKFYQKSSPAVQKKIRRMFRECDCLIVLGASWKAFVREIVPEAKVYCLHNAVHMPENDQCACWDQDMFHILYMGVLIPRKNVDDLLRAAALLMRNTAMKRPFDVRIAGRGKEEDRLRQLSGALGIANRVRFYGWVDGEEKQRLLSGSQCLVLPSSNEGLPVSVLEAMSYALPVIATNAGSTGEVLADGRNGYLLDSHAPEQIAEAVIRLSETEQNWRMLSAHARETIQKTYDETRFFEQLEEIYRKLA